MEEQYLQSLFRFRGTHAAFPDQCPKGRVVEIVDVAFPLLNRSELAVPYFTYARL